MYKDLVLVLVLPRSTKCSQPAFGVRSGWYGWGGMKSNQVNWDNLLGID